MKNIRRNYQIFHISVQTFHHETESGQQDHVDRIQFWYNQWISRSDEFQVYSIVWYFSPSSSACIFVDQKHFFSYEVVEAPDGQFGAETESGSGNWSGLMGMLMRDVSINFWSSCPIFVLSYPNSSSSFISCYSHAFFPVILPYSYDISLS